MFSAFSWASPTPCWRFLPRPVACLTSGWSLLIISHPTPPTHSYPQLLVLVHRQHQAVITRRSPSWLRWPRALRQWMTSHLPHSDPVISRTPVLHLDRGLHHESLLSWPAFSQTARRSLRMEWLRLITRLRRFPLSLSLPMELGASHVRPDAQLEIPRRPEMSTQISRCMGSWGPCSGR